tara:strand:- start:145 stop:576 length:432 start_codon:yes stop_codon:yes gene_type:complete
MAGVININGGTYLSDQPLAETTGLSVVGAEYGGGGGGPMEPMIPVKEYIDARDDAVESRLDQKLGTLATASQMRNNIWGAAAAIIGIALAALALAGDRFDGGMSVSPIISKVQENQSKIDKNQDAKLELMDQKLDLLIKQTAN